jgi:hypothetical protein
MLDVSVLSNANQPLILSDVNQGNITQIKTTHVRTVAEVLRVPWVTKLKAFKTTALLTFEHFDQGWLQLLHIETFFLHVVVFVNSLLLGPLSICENKHPTMLVMVLNLL